MSVADDLLNAAHGEVECDGLVFRVRKIRSRELLAAGSRHLVATLAKREGEEYAEETDPALKTAQQVAVLMEADQWCVAAVVATKRPGAVEWEPLRVVAAEAEEDMTSSPPRLWVETLTMRARAAIMNGAAALTLGREGAATIDSFRLGSGPAAVGGSAGEAIR